MCVFVLAKTMRKHQRAITPRRSRISLPLLYTTPGRAATEETTGVEAFELYRGLVHV